MENVYIIAEIGFNHNGEISLAEQAIYAAKEAGANAVKFQSFYAEDICLPGSEHYVLIESGVLTREEYIYLKKVADQSQIDFLSTPFSCEWVHFLNSLDVPAFKIASMDLNFYPMLESIARTRKRVYLSTGMASADEIDRSCEYLRLRGAEDIVLLHCISHYPVTLAEAALPEMLSLCNYNPSEIGYSDHTIGIAAPLAAIALGARVIEKHFTIDKNLPGPDHKISADPNELAELVVGAQMLVPQQNVSKENFYQTRPDEGNRSAFRRGIYAKHDIVAGERITISDLNFVRPEIVPMEALDSIVGAKARCEIRKDTPVAVKNVEKK